MDDTSLLVLMFLKTGKKSGCEIVSDLSRQGIHSFRHREAALYPLLHRLERDKLLKQGFRDLPDGTERRVYTLTGKGRLCLPRNTHAEALPTHPSPAAVTEPADLDMSMRILRMRRWCEDATLLIRVSPDREIVGRELYDHMYDRFRMFLAEGRTPEEAEALTFEAMGDPKEVRSPLGALHRPFWTKALRATRYAMLVLSILTLFVYGLYFLETQYFRPPLQELDPQALPPVSGEHQRIAYLEPESTAHSDGYTLTAARASLWKSTNEDGTSRDLFNIQLEVFTPIPWAEAPDFASWIWAEDSLGNYYYCASEDSMAREPSIQVTDYHTGLLTYVHDMWIYHYVSQEADWIELHYDRSGRDIVLRIDLTRGAQP